MHLITIIKLIMSRDFQTIRFLQNASNNQIGTLPNSMVMYVVTIVHAARQ